MIDPLIEQLADNLQPKKSLSNSGLWIHCTTCLVVAVGFILILMGIRNDYSSAIQSGAMFWKPSLFFLGWIGSIMIITDLSRPTGRIKSWHTAPLLLAGAGLLWQFIEQLSSGSLTAMVQSLKDVSAFYCLSVITGGGIITLLMVWKFWLSKTASINPLLLGILAGFSAGCLVATAYAIHCDKDTALYILVYYGISVATLSAIGGWLGGRFLRW